MIKVINQPRNREEKRKAYHEFKRNYAKLEEVENTFLTYLFNVDPAFSYEDIYLHGLDNWKEAVSWLKRNNKLRYTAVDEKYFTNEYHPIC